MIAQAVIVKDGQVLMVRQRVKRGDEVWNFPGGTIEEGETPEAACVREVKEETGYETSVMLLISRSEHKFTFAARIEGGELHVDKSLKGNEDIVDAAWVSPDDPEKWDEVTKPLLELYKVHFPMKEQKP